MLAHLLFLQLVVAGPPLSTRYATPALARFIAVAAAANRLPPPSLESYRAHVESELSLILRDTLGREHIAQVEQVAMQSQWTRAAAYRLHVIGYRSASVGVPYSALSFTRSWTVPFLYGDRLTLGVEVGGMTSRARPTSKKVGTANDSSGLRQSNATAIHAVHPLAVDRDRF